MQLRSILLGLPAALLRVAIGAIIAIGLIQRLEPFPWYPVAKWQARLTEDNITFPGSEIFFWFTDHWLELAVVVALIQLSCLTRALRAPSQ